jgi:O-antigen/teichoic acid export membrane protein
MSEPRPRGRFVRDVLQILGGRVAMTLIGGAAGVITARALGVHDRGLYQLLVLLPATLANVAKLGIPQAAIYFVRQRGVSASDVASNALWLALVLGGGLACACWVGGDWLLARVLKEAPPAALLPVLGLVPLVALQAHLLGIVQGLERFDEYNLQQVLPRLLELVGMTIVLVVLQRGLSTRC